MFNFWHAYSVQLYLNPSTLINIFENGSATLTVASMFYEDIDCVTYVKQCLNYSVEFAS